MTVSSTVQSIYYFITYVKYNSDVTNKTISLVKCKYTLCCISFSLERIRSKVSLFKKRNMLLLICKDQCILIFHFYDDVNESAT